MYVTAERIKTVDFLAVILNVDYRFIFRAPPLTYTSNIYYLPFTGIVWVCCIVTSFICTMFIYLSFQLRGIKEKQISEGISNCLIISFGIICQVGAEFHPIRLSTRMAIVEHVFKYSKCFVTDSVYICRYFSV